MSTNDSTQWLIPLLQISYSSAVVLQAPALTSLLMLAVVLLLAPIYIEHAHNSIQIEVHTFWNALSIVLGTMLGSFFVEVMNIPRFVTKRDLWMELRVTLRTALVLALLVGSSLAWALIPIRWLNWTMALLIYVCTIVLSTFLFRTGRRMQVSLYNNLELHIWFLLCSVILMVSLGVSESLVSPRNVPVCICAVTTGLLALLALANILLPNVIQRAPKIQDHSDMLAADALDSMTSEQAIKAWRLPWD